jgi:hypothetical protein
VCGAEPIRQVVISNLFEDLRGGAGSTASRRSHRARASLLVFQIGLSVVLLVVSGLVVRSFITCGRSILASRRRMCSR